MLGSRNFQCGDTGGFGSPECDEASSWQREDVGRVEATLVAGEACDFRRTFNCDPRMRPRDVEFRQ